MEAFDVFISYKNSDNGILTKDSFLARELYEFLTKEGIHAFFPASLWQIWGQTVISRSLMTHWTVVVC